MPKGMPGEPVGALAAANPSSVVGELRRSELSQARLADMKRASRDARCEMRIIGRDSSVLLLPDPEPTGKTEVRTATAVLFGSILAARRVVLSGAMWSVGLFQASPRGFRLSLTRLPPTRLSASYASVLSATREFAVAAGFPLPVLRQPRPRFLGYLSAGRSSLAPLRVCCR